MTTWSSTNSCLRMKGCGKTMDDASSWGKGSSAWITATSDHTHVCPVGHKESHSFLYASPLLHQCDQSHKICSLLQDSCVTWKNLTHSIHSVHNIVPRMKSNGKGKGQTRPHYIFRHITTCLSSCAKLNQLASFFCPPFKRMHKRQTYKQ